MSILAGHAGQRIVVEIEGDVGRITLNRPAVRNALDGETVAELEAALDALGGATRAVLIEGAGAHFCAGADLHEVVRLRADPPALRAFIAGINRAFDAAERCPVPVIAAVQGYALAGGFELMQACDLVLVADTAVIGDQHANFGLLPGAGGSQRLPRLVGRQRALALLLTGDRLSGTDAVEWGLALRAVPAAALPDEALLLARRLAAQSSPCLTRLKRLVDGGRALPLDQAIGFETEVFMEYMTAPDGDVAEGLAAFAERRAPVFSRNVSSPPS